MANGLMLAQMGMNVTGGVLSYASQSLDAKMARAVQRYKNTLSAISAAQQQNSVTLNSIAVRDASISEQQSIDEQSMLDVGRAEVAAAVSGAKGQSVGLFMKGLARSAANARYTRLRNLNGQFNAFNQDRRNIAVSAAMQKDISVIPRPSVAAALLGTATSVLNTWDGHQAPGSRISDTLGENWDRLG